MQTLDTGLFSLVMMAKFLGKAADAGDIKHQLGKGGEALDSQDILLAAKALELKAKRVSCEWDQLISTPLPAIARAADNTFFIIAKVEKPRPDAAPETPPKVLVQLPGGTPEVLSKAELEERWSGDLILLTSREHIAGSQRPFDVTWFIPAIVKYRKLLGEALLASFFLQLFALMTPLFFQVVIDKVLVHKGLTTLDVMVFALVVVTIFEVLMGGLRTYVFSHTTNRVDVELGSKLFHHLLALPLSYFESRRVGDSVARVRELDTIRDFLTSSSVTLLIDLLFTFVFLSVMYLYSPTLTWIVIGSIPFYVAISLFITGPLRGRLEEKFARGAENQAFLVESVTGVQTLKSMAVEPQMQRRWEDKLAGYVESSFKANMLGNIGSQSVQLVSKLTTAVTLYVGATIVMAGSITVGQLVAFNMLAGRVAGPVLRLAQLWQDFQQARISLERLGDILNSPTETQYGPSRASLPNMQGKIEFDQVTFRYRPDGREVLRRVSLTIASGEIIGIVGPSGSGKSTLTKLVQRLYIPQSGRILIDGVDLAMVNPTWLRRQVGLFSRRISSSTGLCAKTSPSPIPPSTWTRSSTRPKWRALTILFSSFPRATTPESMSEAAISPVASVSESPSRAH